jgi:hypothetical protein
MRNTRRTPVTVLALLILLFVSPVAFSIPSPGSPARLSGLGLTNDTSWMLEVNEGYFFINPAVLEKLRPQVWGDVWTTSAGLLLNLGKVDLYAVTGMPVSFASFNGIPASPGFTAPTEELIRLGAGMNAGKVALGLSTFATYASYSNATPDSFQDVVAGLNAGAWLPVSPTMSIDAAGAVTYWSVQRHYTPANDYVATPLDFGLRARLNWAIAQNNKVHVFGQYAFENRDYTLAGTLTTSHTNDLAIGLSDEMQIGDALMVFAGGYYTGDFETTAADQVNASTIDAVAGAEYDFTKALAARVGIQKTLLSSTYTRSSGVTTTNNGAAAATTLAAGLGLAVGDLAADMELSIPLLMLGPNFISGVASPWSMDLSVTYYLGAARK